MTRRHAFAALAGIAASMVFSGAFAQTTYPNKPIKIIVPYPAGVSPDVVARLIGDRLAQAVGQPVIIENRVGAGGLIGAEAAAASPADGYNLFFTVKGVMAIVPHLYPNAKFHALRDFKAITQILIVSHILTAAPNVPYNTVAELVDYAKRNPGKIDYASPGVGSQSHVALETWANRWGVKFNHIPYKNNPAPDVMSGVVSLSVEATTTAIPSIQAGKIKALGISGAERNASLPNLPTMTEAGANLDPNGVIGNSWHGLFTPAGTPDDIIAKLNTETVKIVKMPEIQARLKQLGLTPTGTPAAQLTTALASDHAYWGKLVQDLGVKLE